MASKLGFLILSLPVMATVFPYSSAHAALRVNNASLQKEQAQQNVARNVAAQVALTPQPARVITDDNGEQQTISQSDMDACNMIFPNGQFDWAKPTSGRLAGGPATCVALVELRAQQSNGGSLTLATTYLAAGDSMKCNIDEFNELTTAGKGFEYPADAAPTLEDVKKAMAQEQKKNAGFKILGAALVGGIGGNLLGAGAPGDDSPLGFSGDKIKTTAIGAAGAAAVMTASTQSNDYKTGSIILSTGINSAAGAVVGNLSATGEDVIKIGPCKIDKTDGKCVYGKIEVKNRDEDGKPVPVKPGSNEVLLCNLKDSRTYKCDVKKQDNQLDYNKVENCTPISVSTKTIVWTEQKAFICNTSNGNTSDIIKCAKENSGNGYIWTRDKNNTNTGVIEKSSNTSTKCGDDDCFVQFDSAEKAGKNVVAMLDAHDISEGLFGLSDWEKEKTKFTKNHHIYTTRGELMCADGLGETKDSKCNSKDRGGDYAQLDDFTPANQSAEDSDGVDFSNKARAKSTMIGAAGGAGLGALAGASGAETEIQQRLVTEIDNYNNSLQNIWCMTGQRPLSSYNGLFDIPQMKTQD